MPVDVAHSRVRIGPGQKAHRPLALGCWSFGSNQWTGAEDANLLAAMDAALHCGITHFDTAVDYGDGYSEQLIGRFMIGKRDQVFVASKANPSKLTAQHMLDQVDASLRRLQTDTIDLYYIHWPRRGKDMRPVMEGLEIARRQGKIAAIGVSNFTVEQMRQVAEVGTIDAHQLGYNLIWRFAERDILPYCRTHKIAVVTYSSIAHGILTGKYPRDVQIPKGDQRAGILPFRADVWPNVYAGVEQLKAIAQEVGRPLAHLAIRWILQQPGITSVLVGARNAAQIEENASALAGEVIADAVFERMTAISDVIMQHMPDVGNVYDYYP
ncbi:MAG: aldo/keto reductase [Anaerolineae bacterium]|nr:aldo/keto reductase [Anaerolineae bacterium]